MELMTSISTTFNYNIPLEKQLQLIKEAGFEYVSLGMNYEHSGILNDNKLQELALNIKTMGLRVDTVHGYDLDREDSIEVNERVARAAVMLGAAVVVVHCSAFGFSDEEYDAKYTLVSRRIKTLESIAEKYAIQFALENVMPGRPTELCEKMVRLGDPRYIGFCYDSSHDQIDGPRPIDLLKRMKDRLIAVHISDRIKEFMDHVVPGEGFIDFDAIAEVLQKVGYERPLLMEVEMTHSKYKDVEVFLREVQKSAILITNSRLSG